MKKKLSLCFGNKDGKVFLANITDLTSTSTEREKGYECVEIHNVSPSKIHKLLFFIEKRRVLIITESLNIAQIQLDETNINTKVLSVINVKLSITKYNCREDKENLSLFQISWICSGVLACATRTNALRIWDLQNDENYTLLLEGNSNGLVSSDEERIVTVTFNPIFSYLVAGTDQGRCVVWKYNPSHVKKKRWQLLKPYNCSFQGEILSLKWSKNCSTLLTLTDKETIFVTFKPIRPIFKDDVLAFSQTPSLLRICFIDGLSTELDVNMDMKNYSISSSSKDDDDNNSYSCYYVAVCSGKQIRVFRIIYYNTDQQNNYGLNNKVKHNMISDFPSKSTVIALHQETMFILQNENLLVMNLKGIMKLSIRLTSSSSPISVLDNNENTSSSKNNSDNNQISSNTSKKEYPILLDITNDVMAIVTNAGTLIVMHISNNSEHRIEKVGKLDEMAVLDPSSEGGSHNIFNNFNIHSIKCNANGRFVSILSEVDHKLSNNVMQTRTNHSKGFKLLICDTYKKILICSGIDRNGSCAISLTQKVPIEHYWDSSEPYILSCVSRISKKVREVYVLLCKLLIYFDGHFLS